MSEYISAGVNLETVSSVTTPVENHTKIYVDTNYDLAWKDDTGVVNISEKNVPIVYPTTKFHYTHLFSSTAPAYPPASGFEPTSDTYLYPVDPPLPNMFGVLACMSHTSANTVKRFRTITSYTVTAGSVFSALIDINLSTNIVMDLGWSNRGTNTTPTNNHIVIKALLDTGVYYLIGECNNAGAVTTTATRFQFSTATLYLVNIILNDSRDTVTFKIYDTTGTLLWTDTITSNIIPDTTTVYPLLYVYKSTTTTVTTEQMYLDFIGFGHCDGYTRLLGRAP